MKMPVRLNRKFLPLTVTILLFLIMYGAGSMLYTGFFSLQVFLYLLVDNAFLGITAIGMTFVIISGGIDLSVGSVMALTTMISAALLEKANMSPALVIPIALLSGSTLGFLMGSMIHFFKAQPFIVTLGGMFLARGLCYIISIDSISIKNTTYEAISQARIHLPTGQFISVNVLIYLLVIAGAIYLAHYTRFGRTIYAIGGSEQSAVLMGLPVGRTKILIYTMSGFLSSLAGIVMTFYMLSGYGLHAKGMEMDAIFSAVVGGTLLTGGVGYVAGTVFGTLIYGTIQSIITFQGTLSSWWTRIVIGLLIFVFILLQSIFSSRQKKFGSGDTRSGGRKMVKTVLASAQIIDPEKK
ncbi:MAG TPA: galactofuranose ABC transporter, permease protein YjfF [Spirochaetia bacterium]|nr:galactofuranose ABC transporter, permease protein YjfF [Spirochaetia bacterium]